MVLPDDDLELVAKARAGDLDAFGTLVNRHQHRLVNFVRLMMSSAQDRDAAEDVAQEAFLRAYRAGPTDLAGPEALVAVRAGDPKVAVPTAEGPAVAVARCSARRLSNMSRISRRK